MGRDRSSRPASLRRKVAIRHTRRTFAVFCEGTETEPQYLEALRRDPKVSDVAAVDLRIETVNGSGSVPLTLVRAAVNAKERNEREKGEIDEFWCVFDVEWPKNHPNLRQAIDLAESNGVKVAVSNPCFEIWLILHHKSHQGWLDNDNARRLRRTLDGRDGKSLDASRYLPLRETAVKNARALERRHQLDGTKFPDDNPSSGMHLLITAVSMPAD